MAKKKDPTKKVFKEPTQEQLDKLASSMTKYGGNVFDKARACGIDPSLGDSLFDLLEKKCDVFQCESCDRWLENDEREPGGLFCSNCYDKINEKYGDFDDTDGDDFEEDDDFEDEGGLDDELDGEDDEDNDLEKN